MHAQHDAQLAIAKYRLVCPGEAPDSVQQKDTLLKMVVMRAESGAETKYGVKCWSFTHVRNSVGPCKGKLQILKDV